MYFSYVPKYGDLDYLVEKYINNGIRDYTFNFFFDVKNGIYNKDQNINQDTKLEHATEFISAVTNVVQYIKNRLSSVIDVERRIRFFFFCETGKSSYHKGIDFSYKSNRGINDYLLRTESDELFSEVIFFSIYVLRDIINMIPNCYFFLGEYREYDYIPYVVYKRMFTEKDIGIVFSTDKDMYQLGTYTDCFEQLEKQTYQSEWLPARAYINTHNYIERILGKDATPEMLRLGRSFMHKHFSLVRAIIGDTGDGIDGIKGLHYKTLLGLVEKFKLDELLLPRDVYNETITKMDFFKFEYAYENSIFDLEKVKLLEKERKQSKKLDSLLTKEGIKTICKNIALMDFEVMYNRRLSNDKEEIDKILNNETKFKSQQEADDFIKATGLWNEHSYFKISIKI